VFFKEIERRVQSNESSEETTENYLVARASWVFNADQVRGWQPVSEMKTNAVEVLAKAEGFLCPVQ
jgi:hypothetical protein